MTAHVKIARAPRTTRLESSLAHAITGAERSGKRVYAAVIDIKSGQVKLSFEPESSEIRARYETWDDE